MINGNSIRRLFTVLLLGLFALPATALNFVPTEAEWLAWSDQCRARYMASNAGAKSKYRGRVNSATVSAWKAKMGPSLWLHMHHACAGQVHFNRARTAASSSERNREIKTAISDHNYTLSKTTNQNNWYAYFAVSLAQIYRYQEEYDKAIALVSPFTDTNPAYEAPYLQWSLVLRDQDKLSAAIAVLENGNSATEGKSMEIHYFLGLNYHQKGMYDLSLQHAKAAYKLGYPLPGLKNKLMRSGHWE
ncbi:hypothetical protein EYC98_10610 [Halieaceae bacterium IMCC14734]|uniref:Tetratricopeptide repeat protein n=1 Tax=Candidatus Litorirhabdus singularis TaxID=2518993 RepID=A0ABT3TGI6_9GAMM|nr:hypothetical protein [Candidatus Litorirhabdus singularis]MCX2981315.1 hypothetical protein [Candidatus Litorirhabdus singularis]